MEMREAMVQYPTLVGENGEILENSIFKRKIIQSRQQFSDYKKNFPIHYPHVEPHFKRELREGNTIIINEKGGWCIETEEIKIKQYL
jgi:hypothetical protein